MLLDIVPGTPTAVRDTFTNFDCWALGLALCQRYPHLRLRALTGPGQSWVHVLTYEPSTDLFVDVTGAHTFAEVLAAWDDEPYWDAISEVEPERFAGLARTIPEVSTEDGIAAALAAGWTPRP